MEYCLGSVHIVQVFAFILQSAIFYWIYIYTTTPSNVATIQNAKPEMWT